MPNEIGRPTKYKPEYVEMAYNMSLLGATNDEMADSLGVNRDTFYEWQKIYPDFSDALKRGKLPADAEVVRALLNKATGKDSSPDTGACMIWLANRRKWRRSDPKEDTASDMPPTETFDTDEKPAIPTE